jgi:hypothetical protein
MFTCRQWLYNSIRLVNNTFHCMNRQLLTIAGHNQQWIDGSIPMVSADTFGLILIDIMDTSAKDFFYI